MIVYRITNKKYASNISGVGAALFPGRWNKKGIPVLYTGASKEIALLETVVHLPLFMTPKLDLLTLEIPDGSIQTIETNHLPKNWSDYPAPTILSDIGNTWVLSNESIALRVPSSIIHSSYNFILNCNHPSYNEVKIVSQEDFPFDKRLIR